MQKIAHRGGASYAPENSLKSFKKALEKGIKIIEFDVRCTKDRKVIVIHDRNVDRTTDGKGSVRDLTFKQLKKLHNAEGESVPTLDRVLKLLKGKCICKIDIKRRGPEEDIVKMVKRRNMEKSVIITSGALGVVKKVKQMCPEIKVEAGGFQERIPIKKMVKKAKDVNADIISMHYLITTKKLVDESHKAGLKVSVWPINDKKAMKKMKKLGVDAITTKYPDKV